MPLPKIIFVTNMFPSETQPFLGTFVKNGYLGLQKLGRDVSVISLQRHSSAISAYARFYWQAFRTLKGFSGIAYVHYVSHSALPALAAKLINKDMKLALHFHGSDAFPESYESRPKAAVKKFICNYAIRHADMIIAPSSIFADRLAEKFNIAREKISVNASAGVNEKIFHNVSRSPEKTKQVLFASRMIPGKGAVTSASILKAIFLQSSADFHAVLIGDGPEREQAETILHDAKDKQLVKFMAAVDQRQLARHYQDSDIFIFASTRKGESLGLVLLEAIFCGAVPIAFDNMAARSILDCSYASILLAKDKDEMQKNLNTLLLMSAAELSAINAELQDNNRQYESGRVSQELNQLLV